MITQTEQEEAEDIMAVPATYSNNVSWSCNDFGLRLTFGEESIMPGEAPTRRVAIFLPYPVVRNMLNGIGKTWEENEQKLKALLEAQGQAKQSCLSG